MKERLDPEVRVLLEAIEAQGAPPLESLPPEEARKAAMEGLKEVAGEPEQVAAVQDLRIPGPGGAIRLRVYTPEGEGPRPSLIYFHGGGWVVCDLDTHDVVCRAIARRSGAVVVAVDYRLAPEHKFPAAVEDSYAATLWVAANAGRLGIDPRGIAVGGDSAGGNLAAVVSLRCRDEGGPALALQVLVYPVTNLASFDTPSYRDFAEGYYLTRAEMEWFRAHYLARLEDGAHPHASPLLAPDLRGLPPALVITAECDVLRDEGEAYAKRLAEAGVPVTCTRYPGMIHAFFSMPGALSEGRKAILQVATAVRGMTSRPASPGETGRAQTGDEA
jgi:acetyl esterase